MANEDDNGKVSIEDMDNATLPALLPGTSEQLSFDLGSEYNLSDSTLKLNSIPALSVDGQFSEGDRFKVILEIEVEYVAFPPIKDRGFRVGTERRHFGQVLSATPVQ
ncbi:MAG: hypothetical protein J2P57_07755 [Acidimicrobiaceae bacterium]|nr:hypothetical protein [Acidimicrobiaceae bacterium]